MPLVLASLLLAACESSTPTTSPSAPSWNLIPSSASASDFAGMWNGAWTVSQTSIPWAHRGDQHSYQLRLAVVGDRVEGYIVLASASNDSLAGYVSGALQPDHKLELEGYTPDAGMGGSGFGEFTCRLTLWFSAGVFQGTLDYEVLHQTVTDYRATHELTKGTLSVALRSPDPASTFEGTWRGWYLIRTCDVLGWTYCGAPGVDEMGGLELVLSQSGGVVTGTLWPNYSSGAVEPYIYRINVSGVASGDVLELSGSGGPWQAMPHATRRLLAFTARRDRLGRLFGNLTWQEEYSNPAGPAGLYRTVRTGELKGVFQLQ